MQPHRRNRVPTLAHPCCPATPKSRPSYVVQKPNSQLSGSKNGQVALKVVKTGRGGLWNPMPPFRGKQAAPSMEADAKSTGEGSLDPQATAKLLQKQSPQELRSLTGVVESVGQIKVTLTCGGHRGR